MNLVSLVWNLWLKIIWYKIIIALILETFFPSLSQYFWYWFRIWPTLRYVACMFMLLNFNITPTIKNSFYFIKKRFSDIMDILCMIKLWFKQSRCSIQWLSLSANWSSIYGNLSPILVIFTYTTLRRFYLESINLNLIASRGWYIRLC